SVHHRGAVVPTAPSVSVVALPLAVGGSGPVALRVKDPVGSLWVMRSPKEVERRAWRKRLERRYRRLGASRQFIDQMADGNRVVALINLKKQALSGDPAAINVYGDFTYWSCFAHRSPEQLDSYATTQVQESRSLPAAAAEWFRDAFAEDVALDKAVGAACRE